jgi:hypothetical protein
MIEAGQLRKFHDDQNLGKIFLVVGLGSPDRPVTSGAWQVLMEDRVFHLGSNYIENASYVIDETR